MVQIPDIIFLALGLACLTVLLSIRKELRTLTRQGSKRKPSEWPLEDQLKHRVKYLHQCRRLERHLHTIKN
jgi:hypothetical protein